MNPPDASKSRDYSEWRAMRMCSMRPRITRSRLVLAPKRGSTAKNTTITRLEEHEHERFARTDRSRGRAVIVRSHRVCAGAGASALRPGNQSRNREENCCGCRRGGKEE